MLDVQGRFENKKLEIGSMSYNPRSSITEFFKAALRQADDIVFCFAIASMGIVALVVLIKNIALGTHSDADWRIPRLVLFMVPGLTLLYFKMNLFYSRQNDKFGRLFKALCLLFVTVYCFVKIL